MHSRWLQAAMKILVKKPVDYTKDELNKFKDIVLLGGQVQIKGLEDRILNCKALAMCFINDELVGVSAIKKPNESKTKRTLEKAKLNNHLIPKFELGYSVTMKEHRGKGINSQLNDKLLSLMEKNESIYATTSVESMKAYLSKRGFVKVGESFEGAINETLEYFELKL